MGPPGGPLGPGDQIGTFPPANMVFAGMVSAPAGWKPTMGFPNGMPGPWGPGGKGMIMNDNWPMPSGGMGPIPNAGPNQFRPPGAVMPHSNDILAADGNSYIHQGEQPGFVALWDLEASYTENELRKDLIEFDFEPIDVVSCPSSEDRAAFGLSFKEESTAAAMEVALHGLHPPDRVFRKCKDSVRVAVWREWDDSGIVPETVHKAMEMRWPEMRL